MSRLDTTLTPLNLINRIGTFDLDPCGYHGHGTAKTLIVLPDDGLLKDWHGLVWCNPPYSNPRPWLERMSAHDNGIALVLASVETKWFQELVFNKANAILFIAGRPKFHREDMSFVQLMRPTVLVAYGTEAARKLKRSNIDGKLVELTVPTDTEDSIS
jgi:hypothetical protein